MLDITPTVVDPSPVIDLTEIIFALDNINSQQIVTNTFLSIVVGFLFAFSFLAFVFMKK